MHKRCFLFLYHIILIIQSILTIKFYMFTKLNNILCVWYEAKQGIDKPTIHF